ncbi:MAG: DUF4135 domain-containing protein [Vicinamibacterales bacterium]
MAGRRIPTSRWRFLVQERVLTAQRRLSNYLNNLARPDRAFVAPALTGRPLTQLLAGLGGMLDDLVAPAVVEDLRRLSGSGVLYRAQFDGPSMTIARIAAAFADVQPAPPSSAVPHDTAYRRYMDWMLGRNWRAPAARWISRSRTPDPYVQAFFDRHPAAGYVLDRVCTHFVENLTEACGRVLADRAGLAAVFFDGRQPAALARISSTGSDFHKGGHQVLILEFAGQRGAVTRVVYKPSDVEIDYLLVGRNAAIRPFLQAHDNPGYPTPVESLAERLNRLCRDGNAEVARRLWPAGADAPVARVELATYRILPRNPGSRLALGPDGRLPIEQSYGYVEYLTYEPTLKSPCPRFPGQIEAEVARQLGGQTPPGADWVTSDPAVEGALFYQWGQWMVLTLLAGTSDVHVQNQRLHALKPHVIDLEESFKWSQGFTGSYISWHYDRPDEPAGRTRVYVMETRRQRTVPIGEDLPDRATDFAKNQLYRQSGGAATRARPGRNGNLQRIVDGIRVATLGVRAAAANDDVVPWLNALGHVVVRHVPQPTGEFAEALRSYYAALLAADGRPPLQAPVTRDAVVDVLVGRSRDAATQKVATWKGQGGRVPFFALETRENNLRDFADIDIPFYVRRLGETEVRNSAGAVVNLHAAWVELGQPSLTPQALPVHYFAHQAPGAFADRVTGWRDMDEAAFVAAVTTLVHDTFTGAGDLAVLRQMLFPPPPGPQP